MPGGPRIIGFDADGARRSLRSYRAAGGPGVIGEAEAYGGLPDALAYLAGQAYSSLDEALPPELRAHSTRETVLLLSDPPSPDLFEQILALAAKTS
ncbi:hypothetical protein [Flindersiella endophytica]